MPKFTESEVEEAALEWLREIGYDIVYGPDIAPDQPATERSSYSEVVLKSRLRANLTALNPDIPEVAIDEAIRKLTVTDRPTLITSNHTVHKYLVDGVPVEYQTSEGRIKSDQVQVFDYADPTNNEFLAVNQFTVIENGADRRPDIVLFVNGLPLAVFELKNAADEGADIWRAYNQLDTYKNQIPSLFHYNESLVISDGIHARLGTLTSDRERFMPWRTIDGEKIAENVYTQLEVMVRGVFHPSRFLDLVRYFTVFEDQGDDILIKKVAGYHQFHAVNVALAETVRASKEVQAIIEAGGTYSSRPQINARPGDRRVGVVWHTQGSGKSLTMAFYAGRVVQHPEMRNPTIVVLTDRNDLDDQLFGTFAKCHEILRQPPEQAMDRGHLRELLTVASGGVIFTTVHKFFPSKEEQAYPLLSDRRNIVVVADEAHRSQYDFIDGFARHMRDALPNASFIGFTGTPIERADANTKSVFGDYISIYDIARAVEDGATVRIYYESRLARLFLDEAQKPTLDSDFEQVTEDQEEQSKERLKSKWAALEAVVGAQERLALIAADLASHFEDRLASLDGKAMIVCMSRRICVELYDEIIKLRPDWHHEEDDRGVIKVVMTGSASDDPHWRPHIRPKQRREQIATIFKDPSTPIKLVIVRDMWLTGFDAPCVHTMYVDKPMKGHGLMQAIARVNRVFTEKKTGGLIVDYLGLADQLRSAVADYTEGGGKGDVAVDVAEAVAVMQERYEVCCGIMHGFDWSAWASGTSSVRLSLLPAAQEHVLKQQQGKERFRVAVSELSKAFALAVPQEEALAIRDDVGFFQALNAVLTKSAGETTKTKDELDHAIRQIVSRAVSSDEVIDIFAAAGLKKPDISILSDEFLVEMTKMPHKNLAVEMLRKLLSGEIKTRQKTNTVQARSFSEMLEATIRKYQNRGIETSQIIEELIELAKQMREADRRGEQLGLTPDEIAFYDALEANDSAVQVMGDEKLKLIAQELVRAVKKNVTIDWEVRENVRAQMRVIIKRILNKYGYPPDKRVHATELILAQAEVLCKSSPGFAVG